MSEPKFNEKTGKWYVIKHGGMCDDCCFDSEDGCSGECEDTRNNATSYCLEVDPPTIKDKRKK
jgi:hypothetical protein